MASCPSCNASVSPEDAFCVECGQPITAQAVTPRVSDPQLVTRAHQVSVPAGGAETASDGGGGACGNCGRPVDASATVCPSCGYELRQTAGGSPTSPPPIASDRPVIPGTPIALGDGETIWRQYLVTGFPRFEIFGIPLTRTEGSGTLYVTDSRLLFFASLEQRRARRKSVLIQETQLEHVTGISAYVSQSFSVFAVIAVALVGILGLILLAKGSALVGLVFLAFAVVGGLLLAQGLARRGTLGLRVSSGAAQASPIGFGQMGDSRRGLLRSLLGPFGAVMTGLTGPQNASDMLMALPARDAQQVIVELGALITDLQSKGSLAETHWGRQVGSPMPAGSADPSVSGQPR